MNSNAPNSTVTKLNTLFSGTTKLKISASAIAKSGPLKNWVPGDHIVADAEVEDGDSPDSREDVAAVGFIVEERDRLCGRCRSHAADNRNRLEQ